MLFAEDGTSHLFNLDRTTLASSFSEGFLKWIFHTFTLKKPSCPFRGIGLSNLLGLESKNP
jgi:hypothetical protein